MAHDFSVLYVVVDREGWGAAQTILLRQSVLSEIQIACTVSLLKCFPGASLFWVEVAEPCMEPVLSTSLHYPHTACNSAAPIPFIASNEPCPSSLKPAHIMSCLKCAPSFLPPTRILLHSQLCPCVPGFHFAVLFSNSLFSWGSRYSLKYSTPCIIIVCLA